MNHSKAPPPPPTPKVLDVVAAVEELHNLSAKEMNKLLRDPQNNFTLRLRTGRGSFIRVDMERLVSSLPLHLLACLASRGAESRLRYLLRGVRLLHSLSDLALRHPKLEQIMLQEVKIREQILDLTIYTLIILASTEQEVRMGSSFTILHAALVACCLYLLPAFVATEWPDVVPVLLAHPKVDIFMDAAFDAVKRDICLLQCKLRILNSKLLNKKTTPASAECVAQVIAQQCEASVQVLQSLCLPDSFRDRLLSHKELCRKGGLLRLTLTILKLQLPYSLTESKYLVAMVSRLQSKMLSMLVKFCETESVSFLDEVAANARSMQLAELVAGEVLALVRIALLEDPRKIQGSTDEESPARLLYIHAMRLADIFSDDSNFRNSVMDHIAPDLARVLAQAPPVFSSGWCQNCAMVDAMKSGSDAVLIYDPFRAAGAAMQSFKCSAGPSGSCSRLSDEVSGCSLSSEQMNPASYAQERSSLFVKILANLHCFDPEICPADEKDRFLKLFVNCLIVGPFNRGNSSFFLSTVQTAVRVCENLFLLLDYVSSLPSEAVSDEDLQLVSTFYDALHDAICPSGASDASMQEDPVVAYVKDAHEQKRKIMLLQWQQSERWQRIQRLSEPSDREQSNAGSSINKVFTKGPASQHNLENDTCQVSEEAQSTGNRSLAKRKRETNEPEDETNQLKKKKDFVEQLGKQEGAPEWITKGTDSKKHIDMALKVQVTEDMKLTGHGNMHNDTVDGRGTGSGRVNIEIAGQINRDISGNDAVRYRNKVGDELNHENERTREAEEATTEIYQDAFLKFKNQGLDKVDERFEGIKIFENTELCKIHEYYQNNFGKAKLKTELHIKDEDISEFEIKADTDMRQESSQSAVGNVIAGSMENDNYATGGYGMQRDIIAAMYEEMQPKKRKRNIMNDKQMVAIENALKTEPDMQRYPKLIQHWTNHLNKLGPELSYQQLKNWLNNRKARLARQAREVEAQARAFESDAVTSLERAYHSRYAPGQNNNHSGSSNEPKGVMCEDGNIQDSGGIKRNSKLVKIPGILKANTSFEDGDGINIIPAELDVYYRHNCEYAEFTDIGKASSSSHRSPAVKFVKCEVGQFVSLLDKDGTEVAIGIVHQVDGKWQGKKLDEQGFCIVKVTKLKVEKSMKLPHPSNSAGNTFEEAETLCGGMFVAWDTNRIFLRS